MWIAPGKRQTNPEKGRAGPEKGRITPPKAPPSKALRLLKTRKNYLKTLGKSV
jgi:hypothetical protein